MLRLYKVSVEVSYTVDEVVEARTQEEAQELALNQAGFGTEREAFLTVQEVEDLGEVDWSDADEEALDLLDLDLDDVEFDND